MEILGQPQRSATQDANAGIVEPSHEKKMGRSTAVKQKKASPLDSAVSNFGEAFGNVIQQFTEEAAGNRAEQKALDGHLRQGTDTAINEIARDKKRGVVMSGIFGQDIEYRAAQQRATENVVRDKFNEQMTVIDQFAGEAPDRYQIRLKDQLNGMLEPYGQDQDTKNLVTNAWMQASEKLSKEQFKGHYVYNQQQQRETTEQMVKGIHDSHTLVAMKATSPEEQTDIFNIAKEMYSDKSKVKPNGMSNEAWRGVLTGQINEQMEAGNIGATNIARMSGFLDSYLPVEQANFDKAVAVYDKKADDDMASALDYWEIDVLRLDSIDAVDSYIVAAQEEARNARLRESGTERYEEIITDAEVKLERLRKKATKKAAGRSAQLNRDEKLAAQLRRPDTIAAAGDITIPTHKDPETGATIREKSYNKREWDNAGNINITRYTAESMGVHVYDPDNPTAGGLKQNEVLPAMLGNPAHAQRASEYYKKSKYPIPIIGEGFRHVLKGVESGEMTDPKTGLFSEQAKTSYASMQNFNGPTLAGDLGAELYQDYQMQQDYVSMGRSVENYERDRALLNTADSGSAGIPNWSGDPEVSNRNFIRNKLRGLMDAEPTAKQIAESYNQFQRSMKMTKDVKASLQDFRDIQMGNTTEFLGMKLDGKPDKDWDFNLEDTFKEADVNNVFAMYIASATGTHEFTKFAELDNLTYAADYTAGGLTVQGPGFRQKVVIPWAILEEQNEELKEDREFELMFDAAKALSNSKKLSDEDSFTGSFKTHLGL